MANFLKCTDSGGNFDYVYLTKSRSPTQSDHRTLAELVLANPPVSILVTDPADSIDRQLRDFGR